MRKPVHEIAAMIAEDIRTCQAERQSERQWNAFLVDITATDRYQLGDGEMIAQPSELISGDFQQ